MQGGDSFKVKKMSGFIKDETKTSYCLTAHNSIYSFGW